MEAIKNWIINHPNLSAWFALATGMVILLVYEARDVGLQGSQWFWLVVVTVLVAGACIWIISWGDDEEELAEDVATDAAADAATSAADAATSAAAGKEST